MPVKRTTTDAQISSYIEERTAAVRQACINNFIYVGEQAVREARQRGRYKDRTGNLRSSIGYCVADNGKIVRESSFDVVSGGGEGSRDGAAFLHRLVSGHSSGIVLIIVAGMEYAAYVEAKNLNVLDSAEQLAERLLPKLFEKLKI